MTFSKIKNTFDACCCIDNRMKSDENKKNAIAKFLYWFISHPRAILTRTTILITFSTVKDNVEWKSWTRGRSRSIKSTAFQNSGLDNITQCPVKYFLENCSRFLTLLLALCVILSDQKTNKVDKKENQSRLFPSFNSLNSSNTCY